MTINVRYIIDSEHYALHSVRRGNDCPTAFVSKSLLYFGIHVILNDGIHDLTRATQSSAGNQSTICCKNILKLISLEKDEIHVHLDQ